MTDLISAIANCVVAITAAAGLVIAGLGLSTWRKQLKGTTEYELAKRLLLQVYRVRSAVEHVRRPFLMTSEAGEPQEGIPWQVAVYQNRWQGVADAMAEFQAVSLECEVIWGKDIASLQSGLTTQIFTLLNAVDAFNRARLDAAFQDDFTREHRDTLYPTSDNDRYRKDFDAVIRKFEGYVKPHLKRKS